MCVFARSVAFLWLKKARTRPRGARPDIAAVAYGLGSVSIHAPAWGATRGWGISPGRDTVSIHAPAWGATRKGQAIAPAVRVSIHAPAWGATGVARQGQPGGRVSIHAPAWGATPILPSFSALMSGFNPRARVGRDARILLRPLTCACFNPRARVGRDHTPSGFMLRPFQVSIHAPAWGATPLPTPPPANPCRFNPRARVGRDMT